MKKSILLGLVILSNGLNATTFLNISSYPCRVESSINEKSYTLPPQSRQEIPGEEFTVYRPAVDSNDPFSDLKGSVMLKTNVESGEKSSAEMVYANKDQKVIVIDFGKLSGGKIFLTPTLTVTPVTYEHAKEKYPLLFERKKAAMPKKNVATFINISPKNAIRVQQQETIFEHKALTLIDRLSAQQIEAPQEGGSFTITAATKDGAMIGSIETLVLNDVKSGLAYIIEVKDETITAEPMMEVHAKRKYEKYYKNMNQN